MVAVEPDAESPGALLEPILKAILSEASADCVCVFGAQYGLAQADLLALLPPEEEARLSQIHPYEWFSGHNNTVVLSAAELAQTGYSSALLIPVSTVSETLGVIGIFSESRHRFAIAGLSRWSKVVAAILENQQLRDQQRLNHTIQGAARIISDSASPQEIVNLLRLFSSKVTTCAVMFYGPLGEPDRPFDYLEVQGTWSKRYGTGVGIGVRLYLELYPDLLAELNEHKVLVLPSMSALKERVDSLLQGFLRAERVRSAVMLSLNAAGRQLGMVFLATDRPIAFTPQEIRSYRLVSEFLAVGMMTQVLRQQRDLVEQGRVALLDAVTDGVVMVVPDTHPASGAGHVLTFNHAFSAMFNISEAQAHTASLDTLLEGMRLSEETTFKLAAQWLKTPVRDPAKQSGEFEMMHPQGYPTTIEWYSAPVYQGRRVMGRLYIFHDVSGKRTAERLRANFIARLSHELRTPLSSIKGYAQLMLEESNAFLPERSRENIQTIFDNATHLNRMFTDVIQLARADTGDLRLTIKAASLPDLIQSMVRMVDGKASGRGQSLRLVMPDDLPLVRMDVHYIGQVLSQLLNNAVTYGPGDSVIRVEVTHVFQAKHLPHGAPDDTVLPAVVVTVSDRGDSLLPEEADQIFAPFYRGKTASLLNPEGTGLGLTTARSIVGLHRGRLWVESRRRGRRGTHFNLLLPITSEA